MLVYVPVMSEDSQAQEDSRQDGSREYDIGCDRWTHVTILEPISMGSVKVEQTHFYSNDDSSLDRSEGDGQG